MKRLFDIILSFVGIMILFPVLFLLLIVASITTNSFGVFIQQRVGQYGKLFNIYKFKSMKDTDGFVLDVTIANDPRITPFGRFMRKFKLDELPQLFNILKGDMSFVGPRPDVEGFADKLMGADKVILSVKPGVTGPATLYFGDEEFLLTQVENPVLYNREVIWPKKIVLNKKYIKEFSFKKDIVYILYSLRLMKFPKENY